MIYRPDIVKDEHIKYLDRLQASGVTNMFGATEYLVPFFSLSRDDAKEILMYWMRSYDELHPPKPPADPGKKPLIETRGSYTPTQNQVAPPPP